MGHAIRKRQNIDQINQILRDHPEGLTRSQLAKRIGVNRSTITKYLDGNDLPFVYEDGNKLKLDREGNAIRLTFDLDEITMLHVATRLLARQTNRHNPHAASALRKLSQVVQRADENIGRHISNAADLVDSDRQLRDLEYLDVLRKLTESRTRGFKLQVHYELEDGTLVPYTFAPYFLEPYAPGLTTHVIGWREPPGALRTFKVERLRQAEMTTERYTIPSDFDPERLLANAWGIWYTDEEPVEVELKFSPRVRRRVKETRWHRNEQPLEDQPDGGLIWRCAIAEPREMLPWIRGWGADVEVRKPEWLREELVVEGRKLARLYGMAPAAMDPELARVIRCWGKTGSSEAEFHPALYHMLDVSHVAQVLLRDPASRRWCQVLGKAFNADQDLLIEWVPWLVALHDIGKVSAVFQAQNTAQKARLLSEQFAFDTRLHYDIPHAMISQSFLAAELPSLVPACAEPWRQCIAEAMGGHHGQFNTPDAIRDVQDILRLYEPAEWSVLRAKAADFLRMHLQQRELDLVIAPPNISVATAMLNGFTILCDWIGSDGRFFSAHPDAAPSDYILHSLRQARDAVEAAGFLQPVRSDAPVRAADLFSDLRPLRPLQQAIDDIPPDVLVSPCLAIIEAPTGEGKTEAGLALAHRIAALRGTDELYYALPTTATSNQMFRRLQLHLRDRLHIGTAVKLVHGQAFLVEDDLRIEPLGDVDDQAQSASMEWFSPRKRALLAPFGVGTIDQAELAALNVRHTPLRLAGLAGKVVILDEVHAYDTYMTTVIQRLLTWLCAMGSSVILLSATLPVSRRAQLAAAFGASADQGPTPQAAYPSLLVTHGVGEQAHPYASSPPAWQPDRVLRIGTLHFGDDDESVTAKANWLLSQVSEGGCVCWITNTVRRAQELFDRLDTLAPFELDRFLLHSQFSLDDRQQREGQLVAKYGPRGTRPRRGVVIGTQVLEQSLDLDFDVMVSDLAPIDLLLQRAGRMHRHDRPRPTVHGTPCLWVNTALSAPEDEISLRPDNLIYDEYILRLTWRALCGKAAISLPRDYRPLIETVYDAPEPLEDSPLWEAWDKLQAKQSKAYDEARMRLLPEPNPEELFCALTARLNFEEDENSAAWIVAQTRLGEESINVIPLERLDDRTCLGLDGAPLDIGKPIPRETQLRLLRRGMRVSRYEVIRALKDTNAKLPNLFARSVLLKGYFPLWLHGGQAQLPDAKGGANQDAVLNITLDPRLGLVIRPR